MGLWSSAAHSQTVPPWEAAPNSVKGWADRQEHLRVEFTGADPKLLFLGDSLTASWSGPGRAIWQSKFVPLGAFNAGIAGENTQGLLWRIQHAEFSNAHLQTVVLLIGTNDLHQTSDDVAIAKGIEEVARELSIRTAPAKIVVLALLPRGAASSNIRKRIENINRLVKDAANPPSTYVFYDLGGALLTSDGQMKEGAFLPDGVHLETAGYELISAALEQLLLGHDAVAK